MLTVVLTRHGLTDRSEPEQHLGQHIDISLSDAGRRQAEARVELLVAIGQFGQARTEFAASQSRTGSNPTGTGDAVLRRKRTISRWPSQL